MTEKVDEGTESVNARSKLDQLLVDISDIQNQGQARGVSRAENLRPVLASVEPVTAESVTEEVAVPEEIVEKLIAADPAPIANETNDADLNYKEKNAFAPIRMHLSEQVRFQLVMNETEEVVEIQPEKEHVVLQFPDGKSLRIPRT